MKHRSDPAIHPLPVFQGKNELDGEPWKAQTNGSRANGANVSELGDVQVTSRRAEANGLVAVQWEAERVRPAIFRMVLNIFLFFPLRRNGMRNVRSFVRCLKSQ